MKPEFYSGAFATIGTLGTAVLGGWDTAVKALVAFMIVDYITGLLAAIKTKKGISSDVMLWGGIRKGSILVVVAIAVILDNLLGNDSPIFRTLALWFYVGREGLSVLENLGLIGVNLPSWLTGVMEQLKEKGNTTNYEGEDAKKDKLVP